jgi:regulator of replication initiation timing
LCVFAALFSDDEEAIMKQLEALRAENDKLRDRLSSVRQKPSMIPHSTFPDCSLNVP